MAFASIVGFALSLTGTTGCSDDDIGGSGEAGATGTGMEEIGEPGDHDESGGHEGETGATGDGDGDGDGDRPADESGDGDGDEQPAPEGPLAEIPEDEWEPKPNHDGVPEPHPGVYDDLGVADDSDPLRSLLGVKLRDREALDDFLFEVADPLSDIFGQYMSVDEFMAEHAPLAADAELLVDWLEYVGFSVQNVSSSRMLIHFHGTVATFNEVFNTKLHICLRKNPQIGKAPFPVYCAYGNMTLPGFVAARSPGVVTADFPAVPGELTQEGGQIVVEPPENANSGLTPAKVAAIYGLQPLYDQGYDGSGQAIAVITGTRPHFTWMQSFWQSFGIQRPIPEVVPLLETAWIRAVEATMNPGWAGAMAPGARIIQYAGPDTRNSSTLYVYNEAIYRMPGDGASVLTSSLAHREDSEPKLVREMYDASAAMGAAMGLTLMAASGNSAQTDTPSSSPYSLAVGGTEVQADAQGNVISEVAWELSGSGPVLSFPRPPWQDAVAGNISNKHVVVDLALAASPEPGSSYWLYWLSEWGLYGGTSFASPTFAGMVAVMNQYRAENGLPPMGFLGPKLYWIDEVHEQGFRDITVGETIENYAAGPGWDVPSGWGAPQCDKLAELVP
ncbi:MAG: protease pro-enzyme activation domain-containing protein [Enhygromyxa sp.]